MRKPGPLRPLFVRLGAVLLVAAPYFGAWRPARFALASLAADPLLEAHVPRGAAVLGATVHVESAAG